MSTTTATKNISTNSFGFASPKSTHSQTTCHICDRLLYSFEEILVCRACHGSYHWRCVKPETISHYGENANFVCDKCNDNIRTTSASPIHRLTNGGIRIKSPNSSETDYRNFANIPSKLSTTPTKDTTVVNTIRYFEEKYQQQLQQQPPVHKISKFNEFDGHLSSQTNGQYTDDSKTIHRIQQQQTVLESDDENTTSGMFQANYQYTPLKEYAAMKNDRTTNDTNGYQNSSSPNAEHQLSSRYNGGIRYTNKSDRVESPLNNSTYFTSPTIDNLSVHNRQQNFISSTNLNINDNSSRRQQQQNDYRNPLNHSTPYLSQIRDDDSQTFKTSYQQHQQQTDRHSNVGSDSGIVILHSNHPHQITDDNPTIEKKLTDLVQQLGKQLETDAQKLSEKLELKLKNLEYMIHQQTYIIRRQDEVIERLKNKILKIENERDHFRDRLSVHEQREHDEKKFFTATDTEDSINRKLFEHDDLQPTSNDISNRKSSTSSSATTEHSRPSSKKAPAPRVVDHHGPLFNNENDPSISQLIKSIPGNQERFVSDSSTPSIATKLVSSVPLIETPAAASRLDDMIHQSNANNIIDLPAPYYNTIEAHYHDSQQIIEPVSIEPPTIRHDDKPIKLKRSSSSSSSSSSSTSAPIYTNPYDRTPTNTSALPPRNSNFHRSLESIPRKTSPTEQTLNLTNKTTSLEFGKRPVGYDDPGSIYILPQEAAHPASQYQDTVKGWLRKQNRDSFFKRVERYYCVLSNNTLLMHKNDHDTKPQKAINLKGAKVIQYEDQKYGPSLELTWSGRHNDPKRYHLYAPNTQEAQQWANGIQAAIQNPDTKSKWQRYRMQT